MNFIKRGSSIRDHLIHPIQVFCELHERKPLYKVDLGRLIPVFYELHERKSPYTLLDTVGRLKQAFSEFHERKFLYNGCSGASETGVL